MVDNVAAIKEWVKKNRPDLIEKIDTFWSRDSLPVGAMFMRDAAQLLMCIGFEAGRKFQYDNPDVSLDDH